MAGYPAFRQYPEYQYATVGQGIDAVTMIQMQAQYLRLLADLYSDPHSSDPRPKPSSHSRTRSAFSQVNTSVKTDSINSYDSPQRSDLKSNLIAKSLPGSHKRGGMDEEDVRKSLDDRTDLREEKPIHGVNKKFEEFLEEEMRKEQLEVPNPQSQKHEFLKRRSQSVSFQLHSHSSKPKAEEAKESDLEMSFSPDSSKHSPKKQMQSSPVKREQSRPPSQSSIHSESDIKKIIAENHILKRENDELKGKIRDLEREIRQFQGKMSELPPESDTDPAVSESARGEVIKPITVLEVPLDSEARSEGASEAQGESGVIVSADGVKEVRFKRGGRKLIYPDGRTTVYFKNSDVKDVFPDGRVVYQFSQTDTIQTTFSDGLQIFKFSNGQLEKHFPDKTKEINFPDGTVKKVSPNGLEETIFPDGTVQRIDGSGVKHIDYVNGQKETVHTDGTRVREFPDGTVKTIPPKKQ